MVFNSMLVVSTAKASADVWQYIACLPETISSDQLLDLVLCFPLQQLGRLALCIWTFFCVPPAPDSYYLYYSYNHSQSSDSNSDSDSDSDSDFDYQDRYYYHDSHSD